MRQKQYPKTVISEKRVYTKYKAPETKPRPFSRAYLKLAGEDRLIARDIIMKRGKITTLQQFNDFKKGNDSINIERYDIITSVFRAMGLDAWTGEPYATNNPTTTISHENNQ